MAQGPLHKGQPNPAGTDVGVKPAPDGVKDTSKASGQKRGIGRNPSPIPSKGQ